MSTIVYRINIRCIEKRNIKVTQKIIIAARFFCPCRNADRQLVDMNHWVHQIKYNM